MLFWAGIVRHGLSANQIVKCFKLKKLKNDMRYQVDFLLQLKLEEILCYFGLWPQTTLGQSVCSIFYFWLVWLVKLNTGVHCYIILTCFCKLWDTMPIIFKTSHQRYSLGKGAHRNFVKLLGKHLCQGHFLIKLQAASDLQLCLKRDSSTDVFLWILQHF